MHLTAATAVSAGQEVCLKWCGSDFGTTPRLVAIRADHKTGIETHELQQALIHIMITPGPLTFLGPRALPCDDFDGRRNP